MTMTSGCWWYKFSYDIISYFPTFLFTLLKQGYLYFWRDEGERAPLSSEQAAALFGNVDDIYRFNSQFLTQLQSCGLDPVEVARCFVRNNSGFTIYTDYCTNYPRWA